MAWGCSSNALILSLLLFSLVSPLHANQARVYPVDSEVYEAIGQLYVAQALSLPSTAGPWSQDELLLMVGRLDGLSLSPDALATYEYVLGKLSPKHSSFSLGATVALEGYLHTNTTDFTANEDWFYNHDRRKALLSLPMEMALADHFYAFADLDLRLGKYDGVTFPLDGSSALYGSSSLTTNVQLAGQIDANVPYRGFGAWGGQGWLLQVGRDKLSWGPGRSGNFMLGDHVQYHNQGRFTAYGNTFKYTFVTSFFPHPDEIWDADQDNTLDNTGSPEPGYSQARPLVGLKMFMAHRFEWRLLGGRVGLSLNEALMYQSGDGSVDLRILNPMMFYHNYFIRSDANSLASMELDVALAAHWNLYAQLAIDELSFGPDEMALPIFRRHPEGMAYMLGLAYAKPKAKGVLFGSLEGVYTDPYLYLRSIHGDATQGTTGLNASRDTLNFVVALRRWFPDKLIYDQAFLGYRHGGDALVGNLEIGYKRYGSWSLSGHLFCMLHGGVDMNTPWTLGDLRRTPTGDAKAFVDAGISGTWNISPALQGYAGLDLLCKIASWKPTYDGQLYLGMQYTP
ncbi:MAG: hypothetical protein RBR15_07320 [Sphaerochaeta sp.]|nr:hypothetical protein [Sphaerochaeta sp.]